MRKYINLFASLFFMSFVNAEASIQAYQSTENTGLNKQERIESIEKYLIDLSLSLKSFENKLDENGKKIKEMDDALKILKTNNLTKISGTPIDKKVAPSIDLKDGDEIQKIKADILSIKNRDIEKLKIDLQDLIETVKNLQTTNYNKSK